jgi:hypothetical protein
MFVRRGCPSTLLKGAGFSCETLAAPSVLQRSPMPVLFSYELGPQFGVVRSSHCNLSPLT